MCNIRLHLYFSPLRENRFFQKHNDRYCRWPLSNSWYRNTVLPLLLIYKRLHSPAVQTKFCLHSLVKLLSELRTSSDTFSLSLTNLFSWQFAAVNFHFRNCFFGFSFHDRLFSVYLYLITFTI